MSDAPLIDDRTDSQVDTQRAPAPCAACLGVLMTSPDATCTCGLSLPATASLPPPPPQAKTPWDVAGRSREAFEDDLRRAANLAWMGEVQVAHKLACAAEVEAGEGLKAAAAGVRAALLSAGLIQTSGLTPLAAARKLVDTARDAPHPAAVAYADAMAGYEAAKARRVEAARVQGALYVGKMEDAVPMGL